MAEMLISMRQLEIISNRFAENAKRLGKQPFPVSKAISVDIEADPTVGHRERLAGVLNPAQMRRLLIVFRSVEPTLPLGIVRRTHDPTVRARGTPCAQKCHL
jgi:hypothetical protein